MDLRILSVNVALPRLIARLDTGPVESGISKIQVTAPSVFVGATNIQGDGQADLTVHGGPDKAVYAYPSDHWLWWAERRFDTVSGAFGENLTTLGATEDEVRIGDRFQWGEAVLEVSQPRAPCYKFAIHTGRADAPQLMTLSNRTGWYFRVIVEGVAPVQGGSLLRIATNSENPDIRQTFRAMFDPRLTPDARAKVRDTPALSEAWRGPLNKILARQK